MEIEVKIRIKDYDAMAKTLLNHGAELLEEGDIVNEYFNHKELQKHGKMLRLRNKRLVSFKRLLSSDTARKCEEIEFKVDDGKHFVQIMEYLEYKIEKRSKRYRKTFSFNGVRLDLDKSKIGNFLEIEGSVHEIKEAAEKLGFQEKDFLTQSYEELGE